MLRALVLFGALIPLLAEDKPQVATPMTRDEQVDLLRLSYAERLARVVMLEAADAGRGDIMNERAWASAMRELNTRFQSLQASHNATGCQPSFNVDSKQLEWMCQEAPKK